MARFRRILAPFDFSALSEAGVRAARELAEIHDGQVTVLHVAQEPAFPSFYKLGALRIYGMVPDMEKVAWRALEKRFGDPDADPRLTYRVTKGDPETQIVRFAAEGGFDLVVLASHGLTGLEHVALGSIAEKVVRLAPCPVLVVKSFPGALQKTARAGRAEEVGEA